LAALLDLLHRWKESALVQRLGYLWDLHGRELSVTQRSALEGLVRPGSKVHLGSRGRFGTTGTVARSWNIIENVPKTILVEPGERRRRRVLFDRTKPSHAR
jgi:predicted transcriptional regulator of viral defense system